MQIVTMPVPAQDGITRDNVTVRVDAVVYFQVVDPVRAVVDVQDYISAVGQVAQTSLRSIIGKSDLDDLLSNRERLNEGLELLIDSPALGWGVQIDRVEIKDVALPESMKRSMSRQAEAERERRARVISADGELQASEKLALGRGGDGEQPGGAAAAAAGDRGAGGVGEELDAGPAVPGGAAAVPGAFDPPATDAGGSGCCRAGRRAAPAGAVGAGLTAGGSNGAAAGDRRRERLRPLRQECSYVRSAGQAAADQQRADLRVAAAEARGRPPSGRPRRRGRAARGGTRRRSPGSARRSR